MKVLSCVTDAHINVPLQESESGDILSLTVNSGLPFVLKSTAILRMFVSMEYVVEREGDKWRVRTTKYTYSLREGEKEIVAYHWHPDNAEVRFPHMHLGAGTQVRHKASMKAHFPTGRVLLEDVLALLHRDFAVTMRTRKWRKILEETRGRFEDRKSWPR